MKTTEEKKELFHNSVEISTLISNLRAYLQLSQAAFAKSLGLSPTHIARFEKGVSVPSSETIDEICKVFCVDRRYFGEHSLGERSAVISVEDAVKKTNPEEGIADRLKNAREEKGWSQSELSERSGVDRTVISRIESGATLTEKPAVKLSDTLEVGVEWLLKGDEEKKAYPVNQRMVQWLWQHEDARREIWYRMHERSTEE